MKTVTTNLPQPILDAVEKWRLEAMNRLPKPRGGKLLEKGGGKYATSEEYRNSIDWEKHVGFPEDSYDHDFTRITSKHNAELDDAMQANVGFYRPALKVVYPTDGYFGWHDNRNAHGLNILFCWSDEDANGYWRHVEPDTGKTVTIKDTPGWSCKMGLYGKEENVRLKHCASANGSVRCTLGYIVKSEAMWEDIIDELS